MTLQEQILPLLSELYYISETDSLWTYSEELPCLEGEKVEEINAQDFWQRLQTVYDSTDFFVVAQAEKYRKLSLLFSNIPHKIYKVGSISCQIYLEGINPFTQSAFVLSAHSVET